MAISIPHSNKKTQVFELAARYPKCILVPFSRNGGKTIPIAKRLEPSVATGSSLLSLDDLTSQVSNFIFLQCYPPFSTERVALILTKKTVNVPFGAIKKAQPFQASKSILRLQFTFQLQPIRKTMNTINQGQFPELCSNRSNSRYSICFNLSNAPLTFLRKN